MSLSMSNFMIFLSLLFTVQCQNDSTTPEQKIETYEQKLHHYIIKNHQTAARPVENPSTPIVVKVGLSLTNIIDLDVKNRVLHLQVWLDLEWKDELSKWKPADFGNISSTRIPSESIWLPDIVLYNMVGDYKKDYKSSFLVNMYHDGTAFWAPPMTMHSSCKVDLTYFPFNSQRCYLKFGSWSYHGFQVDVTNRSDNVDLTNYVVSNKYNLVAVHQRRRVVRYTCCPEPYPDITFFIHIKRKSTYYIHTVILPCMMLSVLSLLVFISPPESGEKITIGLTLLLAFSIFTITVKDKIPESSDTFPLIGSYIELVMILICASIFVTILIVNIHHRGAHQQMPKCLRILVFSCLRYVVCVGLPPNENTVVTRPSAPMQNDEAEQKLLSERVVIKRQQIASEWHVLARIIDRLMFVIFLFATVFLTIALFHRESDESIKLDETLWGLS